MRVDMISGGNCTKKRLMKLENVIESDDDNNVTQFNYRVLRDNKLSDTEIDQLMSKLLIDNLNNVINTVNENLQSSGQKNNLVKIIDYKTTNIRNLEDGGIISNGGGLIYSTNTTKKRNNKHENQIHKKNNNEDNIGSQNLNELNIPIYPVRTNSFENADVKANNLNSDALDIDIEHLKTSYPYDGNIDELKKKRLSFYQGAENSAETAKSSSFCSDPDLEEIGTLITTGSAYKEILDGESILIPRLSAIPRTESMEVHSTTSEQVEEEFDEIEDMFSDDDELSLVDSLDDFTIRMNRISKMQLEQERQANNFYKTAAQNNQKSEAYFVPLVDTEKQLDEHFSLHMPESLRQRLILRQRRREIKKQNQYKNMQWRKASFLEPRRIGELQSENNSSGGRSSFKIIPLPDDFPSKRLLPLKRPPPVAKKITFKPEPPGSFTGGWRPKARHEPGTLKPIAVKSKKLRNEIGMLESYTIDGRGNMKKQLPLGKMDPKIRRSVQGDPKKFVGLRTRPVLPSTTLIQRKPVLKTISSVNSISSLQQIHSSASVSSSERFFDPSAIDGRKKQIMKDGKIDLTPDPESGPIRKMWKTEITEDKILGSPKSVASRKSITPVKIITPVKTILPAKSPKILRKTSTEPRLKGLPSIPGTGNTPKKVLQHTKSTSNLNLPSNINVSFKEDVVRFEDLGEEDSSDKNDFETITENFKVL